VTAVSRTLATFHPGAVPRSKVDRGAESADRAASGPLPLLPAPAADLLPREAVGSLTNLGSVSPYCRLRECRCGRKAASALVGTEVLVAEPSSRRRLRHAGRYRRFSRVPLVARAARARASFTAPVDSGARLR
jgi:hypothetical protein